jgi:hypothetical protein
VTKIKLSLKHISPGLDRSLAATNFMDLTSSPRLIRMGLKSEIGFILLLLRQEYKPNTANDKNISFLIPSIFDLN